MQAEICARRIVSRPLAVLLPFLHPPAVPDSRAHDQRLITAALVVLDDAAYRARTEAVAGPAVRLALRALMPYVADRSGLIAYWDAAQTRAPGCQGQCRHPYYMICAALRDRGWHAPVG